MLLIPPSLSTRWSVAIWYLHVSQVHHDCWCTPSAGNLLILVNCAGAGAKVSFLGNNGGFVTGQCVRQ